MAMPEGLALLQHESSKIMIVLSADLLVHLCPDDNQGTAACSGTQEVALSAFRRVHSIDDMALCMRVTLLIYLQAHATRSSVTHTRV